VREMSLDLLDQGSVGITPSLKMQNLSIGYSLEYSSILTLPRNCLKLSFPLWRPQRNSQNLSYETENFQASESHIGSLLSACTIESLIDVSIWALSHHFFFLCQLNTYSLTEHFKGASSQVTGLVYLQTSSLDG
jgi:hypothetical protein